MARDLRKQEVADAVKAYAASNGLETSVNENGGFTIMKGGPIGNEDIQVSCQDGKLVCSNDELKFRLSEMIMEMPVEAKASRSPENRAIMPKGERCANGGQMKPVSGAVRDIQVAEMTFDDIRNFLCPAASDKDTFMFLKLCQARNLNPFCNEAYLIPYEDKKSGEIKCSMVVGKEAFMRKAEANPAYRGFRAGIIISKGEDLIYREGTLCRKGETLEGGWCEVYRSDRDQPIRSEVSLIEYDKGFGLWAQGKKATMIRKTAVVSGHREAFPGDTSGMYGQEEMGIDIDSSKEVA
jgi:phage recombination protein Bet